jgi:hypothetical protein
MCTIKQNALLDIMLSQERKGIVIQRYQVVRPQWRRPKLLSSFSRRKVSFQRMLRSRLEPLSLAVSEVADGEIAPGHLLAVSCHLLLVRVPFLVGNLALGTTLLTLGDADEGVDERDEEDGAADAGADGDLGGVGEAGPLLLGFLGGGEFVEGFVEFGLASGGVC